jgi:hypothetical protein
MRSIIKMLGLAFMATLAFSVVGALGAGSASALLFLVAGDAASETYTVENLGKPTLETSSKRTVTCESVDGGGTILNKTDVVEKASFTFHKCTSSFAGECTSGTEPKGLIKTLALDGLLVTLLNGKYGILTLPEKSTDEAEFTCKGLLTVTTVVTGNVVGEFTETKAESEVSKTAAKVVFAKGANAGEQAIKDYWTLEGIKAAKLESTLSGGINEGPLESNEQAEGDVKTTNGITLLHK